MVRTMTRTSVVSAVATMMAAASMAMPSVAAPAVTEDQAGSLVAWGSAASEPARTLPAGLQDVPIVDMVAGQNFSAAITHDGKTFAFGSNDLINAVPSVLAEETAVQIASGSSNVGVVTVDGKVRVWGAAPVAGGPNSVPEDLPPVESIAVGGNFAAAVKADGTVNAWGQDAQGQVAGAASLTGVASLALGNAHGYALKTDGTVAAWGQNNMQQTTLPASVTTAGNVKAVAARIFGGLALLTDGTVVTWGNGAAIPASLTGKTVVAIDALGSSNLALDSEGGVTVWGTGFAAELNTPPAELADAEVASIALGGTHVLALVTKVLRLADPTVSGAPQVGKTLTGVAGRFTGAPDLGHQWLADGTPVEGATGTTLVLTEAQLGKQMTFKTIASKGGAELATATSSPTVPVTPAPPVLPPTTTATSKTKISKIVAKRTKVSARVTVVTAPKRTVTGSVKIVVKRGSKTVARTTLKVNGKGLASFNSKKLKPKVRKALAKKGKYRISATYGGARYIKKSAGVAKYRIR